MQIFYINPLESLNIRKDSSLLLALTAQAMNQDCALLFEDDLFLSGPELPQLQFYRFSGELVPGSFYLENFQLGKPFQKQLKENDILHFRLDPPFNEIYLKRLWILQELERLGVRVQNSPRGPLLFNEKLSCLKYPQHSVLSFYGNHLQGFKNFLFKLEQLGIEEFIVKPMESFSGIGVQKIAMEKKGGPPINEVFEALKAQGPFIVQPFMESVYQGELRSVFFKGQELGTILKIPKDGGFLSNLAQGASYEKADLESSVKEICLQHAWRLKEEGVDLIGFDILGDKITEINITCPGLLVEVSQAMGRNLCHDILAI